MKTAIKAISLFLFMQVFLTVSFAQYASFTGHNEPTTTPIRFVGNLPSGPVFEMSLANEKTESYLVVITNREGNVLYSQKMKGENLKRKYNFALENNQLPSDFFVNFEITNLETKKTKRYDVSNEQTVQADFKIARL